MSTKFANSYAKVPKVLDPMHISSLIGSTPAKYLYTSLKYLYFERINSFNSSFSSSLIALGSFIRDQSSSKHFNNKAFVSGLYVLKHESEKSHGVLINYRFPRNLSPGLGSAFISAINSGVYIVLVAAIFSMTFTFSTYIS